MVQRKQTVELLQESPAYCLKGPAEQYLEVVCSQCSEGTDAAVGKCPGCPLARLEVWSALQASSCLISSNTAITEEGCNEDKLSYGYSELQRCSLRLSIFKKKDSKTLPIESLSSSVM